MKKKLFVISDIHGHYKIAKKALKEKGYDSENKNHLLIVLGDQFDRGPESKEVYFWLKKLTDENKAIVLYGNHEEFIISFLEDTSNSFINYNHNGLKETINSFLQEDANFMEYVNSLYDQNKFEGWYGSFSTFQKLFSKKMNYKYPELLPWLKKLPYFLETKNYIFTHASVNEKVLDWHLTYWPEACWDKGDFINKKLNNTYNKTVVVGHFATDVIRKNNNIDIKSIKDNQILEYEDKIFLDANTIVTKRINVLVLEDELLETKLT